MSKKLHVRTGDLVIVVSGDDKGKKGRVLQASPKEGKIIVEKINQVSKHIKPRKMGDPGGIITAEAAFYACKVQLYCPNCKKASRIRMNVLGDGKKERVCTKCNTSLERRG